MKTIKFMSHRKLAMSISGLLLVLSIYSLATQQLNWGLDFTGGTLVEVHYSDSADLGAIRSALTNSGYAGAVVVSFGSDRDVMIRLPQGYSDEQGVELLGTLQKSFGGDVELRRMEFVGPQVGDELREQAGLRCCWHWVLSPCISRSGFNSSLRWVLLQRLCMTLS